MKKINNRGKKKGTGINRNGMLSNKFKYTITVILDCKSKIIRAITNILIY